jgi:hypothetical protein
MNVIATLLLFILFTHTNAETRDGWIFKCFPVASCESCTALEQKSLEYCQKTGKREPVECSVEWMGKHPVNASYPPQPSLEDAPEYRSCSDRGGRSLFLFALFNFFLLALSTATLLVRTRSMYADRIKAFVRKVFGIPISS